MQALRYFSRIRSLTTRSLYSKGQTNSEIAPLDPGVYHFYCKSGYLALKDKQLISTVLFPLMPRATINVVKKEIPLLKISVFLFQEESTQKWVKFTSNGNSLVDQFRDATFMLAAGFKENIPKPPFPLPIPDVSLTGYAFITKGLNLQKPKLVAVAGISQPVRLVELSTDPQKTAQEAVKEAFILVKTKNT